MSCVPVGKLQEPQRLFIWGSVSTFLVTVRRLWLSPAKSNLPMETIHGSLKTCYVELSLRLKHSIQHGSSLRQKENSAKKIREVPKTVQIHQAPLLLRINIKDYWESFSDCTACKDGSQRRRTQKTALRLAKWPKGSRSQLSCLVMTLQPVHLPRARQCAAGSQLLWTLTHAEVGFW